MNNFDFIGDIHGSYDKLIQLLEKLDYQKDSDGIYFHESRKVFFLGDIVDGGDQVVKCFNLVKQIVRKGYAKAIMGNHEINLLAINTPTKNGFLRERSNKNLKQCKKSLELILGKNSEDNMNFLSELPLFFENDKFRAIHACWHPESIKTLKNFLDKDFKIKDIKKLYSDGNGYSAMEKTLKGLELNLPEKYHYTDPYGNVRDHCRYMWWGKRSVEDRIDAKDSELEIPYKKYKNDKLVFFGHYWLKGKPKLQDKKALCLDYSAMKGGYLTAYRYSAEDCLNSKNLVYV